MADKLSTVGVGVVGLGIMGSAYVRILSESPVARVVGVADISQEALEAITTQYGVEGYAGFEDLMEREDLEAVCICTPEYLHVEPARAAAERGLHMLIEKPVAHTVEAADEIIAAAQAGGAKLMVGHILRFDPRYALAQAAIARGDVGDVVHIYARRNGLAAEGRYYRGRTSLPFYVGVHDLDIMRWFTGSEVVRVYAEGARKVLAGLDVDDTVMAVIKFASGAVGSLELSWALPDDSHLEWDCALELVGTRGALKIEVQRQGVEIFTPDGVLFPETTYMPQVGGAMVGILQQEIGHFLACVAGGGQPLTGGADAREAVRVAAAVERSLETGQPVVP